MGIAEKIRNSQDKERTLRNSIEINIRLYTDKSHFVYELLQNAEDAEATKIIFIQYPDRLEVMHNGHPFTDENLLGLCDIGLSNKSKDLNKIGEFGVGFKAVFGICEEVYLYSQPDEKDLTESCCPFSVAIRNFIEVDEIETKPVPKGYTTRFVFPYCVGKSFSSFATIEELQNRLSDRLCDLGTTTLLFMKNLKSIEYEIDLIGKKSSGCYVQNYREISDSCRFAEAVGEAQEQEDDSAYLVFSRKIDERSPRTIDIAFSVEKEEKGKFIFRSAASPYISVYFPTGTESKLPFIVQGPYRTTPNRSEIPEDNEENCRLVRLTAELLYDSIIELRDMGQISLELLSLLPLTMPEFITNWLFKPLYEKTKELFSNESILPCLNGGYTDAPHAMIGRRNQRLSSVFPDEIMSELKGRRDITGNIWEYKWLPTDLTENTFGDLHDYLLKVHNIFEIRLEHLAKLLGDNSAFLSNRTDSWIEEFYDFLDDFSGTLLDFTAKDKNLLDIPIVKTQSGSFAAPYDRKSKQPKVFFAGMGIIPGMLYVSEPFATDCRNFLQEKLRLTFPSFKDEIYNVLVPKYEFGEPVNEDEDFKTCFRYYERCASVEKDEYIQTIGNCSFVRSFVDSDVNMANSYDVAKKLYFPDEHLRQYFSGCKTARFVDFEYYKNLLKISDYKFLRSFLADLGVHSAPQIVEVSPEINDVYTSNYPYVYIAEEYCRSNKIYWPDKGKNFRWKEQRIHGCSELLAKILQNFSQDLSVLLWHQLISVCEELPYMCTLENKLTGECAYKYYGEKYGYYETDEALKLRHSDWLFDRNGNRVVATDLNIEELSSEYTVNGKAAQELLKFLGICSQPKTIHDNLTPEQREKIAFADRCEAAGITAEELKELLKIKQARDAERFARWSGFPEKNHQEHHAEFGDDSVSTISELQPQGEIIREDTALSIPKIYTEISKRKPHKQISLEKIGSYDEDDYTKHSVDYQKKIEDAKDKSNAEIEEIAALEELQNQALSAEKYSFAWFKALLQLEARNSDDGNSQSREISISFGKVERDPATTRTLLLKQPSRYIPRWIEELSDIPLKLCFDGQSKSVAIEVVNVQSYTLRAKLRTGAEIEGIDLTQVTEAKIEAKSPAFLLDELSSQFEKLKLNDTDNLRDLLCENIEFIFGPPGTGKTTYLAQKVLLPLMQENGKDRVLVLTPTNKAADVLAKKIMDCYPAGNTSYTDWLVRFGTAADESMEQGGIVRDKTFDIRELKKNVTITTIARFPYDFFMPSKERLYLHSLNWDYIIVDEASMIPLVNIIYPLYAKTPKKFIIAGDPFQIEPITSVKLWKNENIYTMVQLQSFTAPKTVPHDYPVTLLTTQYRSIPAVGDIFNKFSYGGILHHHRKPDEQVETGVEKTMGISALNIIRFPVSRYESIYRAKKLKNSPYQTYSALFTYEYIKHYAALIGHSYTGKFNIGVIAPYRAQADLVDRLMASADLPENVSVQVGTIHGFQGDECNAVFALFNPPPYISSVSSAPEMFLNKKNIINVAVSRARDYLFIVMPNADTENIQNLKLVNQIEKLCLESGNCSEFSTSELEQRIFKSEHYLEENSFCTGHQTVNVYGLPELRYEIRSEESAIDVQIHDAGE